MPESWEERKCAGVDWMQGFMKRHLTLRLRKPDNTSLSRWTSFNPSNVNEFYDNYGEVLSNNNIHPMRIYNLDETAVTTVLQSPRVVAESGVKQVGQAVLAERGQLVTFCAIVNATGQTVPPVFIFPRKKFKNIFLRGAPPGSMGLAYETG